MQSMKPLAMVSGEDDRLDSSLSTVTSGQGATQMG
jgi:hypothetical protein